MPRNLRVSLVLAAVAALLIGYIAFFERGTLSSGELEQRKDAALPEFVRARVAKIEIQRKGVVTVLERDPEDTDEGGLWRVTAPYRALADSETVNTLLGELDYLYARRRLSNLSAADRKNFGLDTPRARLWFTVGKVRVPVVIGNDSARGDGTYAQSTDRNGAFVVGRDLIETLDHQPGDYHTKELHEGVYASLTLALSFREARATYSMRKQPDGSWMLSPPLAGLISTPAVTEVVEAVRALRAKHFVEQDAKDLGRYGLSQPQFALTLTKKESFDSTQKDKAPTAKPKPVESEVELRVGNACADYAGERYFMFTDSNTVNCVADADLTKVRKSLAELREGRLLPYEDDDISSVRVERGTRKLVLTKNDKGFTYEITGATTQKGEARADAVADWFKALRAARAERFDAPSLAPQAAPTALRLHIERAQDKPAYDLRLETAHGPDLIAQRPNEPFGMVLPGSTAALLEPSSARFRELDVLALPEASLRALEIRRAGTAAPERLTRPDEKARFAVASPVQAPADSVELGEITRLLASLQAVRFASDAAEPAQGFATPWLTLTIDSVDAAKHKQRTTLLIANETEGGRFAQLSGLAGVFVVPSQFAAHLAEPLASRTLLAVPLERIVALDFDHAGRHVRIERNGQEFIAAAGSKLDPSAARGAAEAIATLRATQVTGYGPADASEGMQSPFATIAVTAHAENGPDQHFTITLGAETQAGARHARGNDQAIAFVVPKEAVEALLAALAQ